MIPREQVLTYLQGKQESCGGYTGNDITELAEFLNVTSQGLNRRLAYWVQSDNASRQKTENRLRKESLEKLRKDLQQLAISEKIEPNILLEYSNVLVNEELQTRIELLEKHSFSCQWILKLINDLTSNMTQGVKFHRIEVNIVYCLATGEIKWDTLNENEKRFIACNPDFLRAIDNGQKEIVPVLAFNRFIDYIRKGKVTFEESYYYQDIGQRIQDIEVPDNEVPSSWTNLSDILKEVSLYVRSVNPTWFSEHQQLFKMQTMNLKYFIQRYISDATLRLEWKFIYKCIEQITNRKIEGVVIDTMGVDARIKSILSTYHGRYHTIGFSDLRAVAYT